MSPRSPRERPSRARLVLAALALCACTARERAPAFTADARAATIERTLPTMRRDTGTVTGLTTEGATIDAAYDGERLRRLDATFMGEMGRAHETYYFDSTLFLVVRQEARYDAPLSGKVQDSSVVRYDLTLAGTRAAQVESLTTRAQELVKALGERERSCLRYEPDTTSITGLLERRTFYGPPNYGDDPANDEKEVGLYLALATPVCAEGGQDPDIDTPQRDVRQVQLVLDADGYARLTPYLAQRVTLRGTLFAAHTGHHHAPLLLTVATPVRVEPER